MKRCVMVRDVVDIESGQLIAEAGSIVTVPANVCADKVTEYTGRAYIDGNLVHLDKSRIMDSVRADSPGSHAHLGMLLLAACVVAGGYAIVSVFF